jgi:WXXGXW repeat (2 copies)
MSLKNWSPAALSMLILLALPAISSAQVSLNVSVNVPPPELPVYDQPPIPGDGYVWTPGYWAWGADIQDFYWVPGTWVPAPQPAFLWTPGYWGAVGAAFVWHAGYWGPHVGFYGGVNYGYGYVGSGYEGGYWQGGHMYYNRSVTNNGTTNITNVYNKNVVNNVTVNRVSYNGGSGGVRAQPTSSELAAAQEHHIAAVPAQRQQAETAQANPELRAKANAGHPPIAATARPGVFSGAGVVAARNAGTMSVVHANPPPSHEPPHAAATATPRQPPANTPRPTDPRAAQGHPTVDPRAEIDHQHTPAPQPAQQQAHPAPTEHPAPTARPAPKPHPEPHPEQHPQEDHEHH